MFFKRILITPFFVFMMVVPPRAGHGQDFRMDSTALGTLGGGGQVLGKTVAADLKKWPATFTFKNAEGGGCTATAIGQKVILTAAHCVKNGATGLVALARASVQVTCSHHPKYPDDISSDFALCVAQNPLPDLGYQRVNTDPALVNVDATIVLLGYGCLQPGGVDRSFGTLYQGTADVQRLTGPDNFIIVSGDSAVCFGDSGGGAFSADSVATRLLIGVNARGDISKTSWLASTSSPTFIDWAKKWSGDKGAAICGISNSAQGCGGG